MIRRSMIKTRSKNNADIAARPLVFSRSAVAESTGDHNALVPGPWSALPTDPASSIDRPCPSTLGFIWI